LRCSAAEKESLGGLRMVYELALWETSRQSHFFYISEDGGCHDWGSQVLKTLADLQFLRKVEVI